MQILTFDIFKQCEVQAVMSLDTFHSPWQATFGPHLLYTNISFRYFVPIQQIILPDYYVITYKNPALVFIYSLTTSFLKKKILSEENQSLYNLTLCRVLVALQFENLSCCFQLIEPASCLK